MYYRVRMVRCGRNCATCPHGPYLYRGTKIGGKTFEQYLGRVKYDNEREAMVERWGKKAGIEIDAQISNL